MPRSPAASEALVPHAACCYIIGSAEERGRCAGGSRAGWLRHAGRRQGIAGRGRAARPGWGWGPAPTQLGDASGTRRRGEGRASHAATLPATSEGEDVLGPARARWPEPACICSGAEWGAGEGAWKGMQGTWSAGGGGEGAAAARVAQEWRAGVLRGRRGVGDVGAWPADRGPGPGRPEEGSSHCRLGAVDGPDGLQQLQARAVVTQAAALRLRGQGVLCWGLTRDEEWEPSHGRRLQRRQGGAGLPAPSAATGATLAPDSLCDPSLSSSLTRSSPAFLAAAPLNTPPRTNSPCCARRPRAWPPRCVRPRPPPPG